VLHLRSDCANLESELQCDDDGGGNRASRLEVDLAPGTYALVLDTYVGGPLPDLGRVTLTMTRENEACVGNGAQTEACPFDPAGGSIRARRCENGTYSSWSECFSRCSVANADCLACTDASEVNDVQALASEVAPGSVVRNLNLCEGLDESDWFATSVPAAGVLTMTATRALNGAFNFMLGAVALDEVNMATTLRSTPDSTAVIAYVDAASPIAST
jgi:hypothetical protein